jgi:hypothetical protein
LALGSPESDTDLDTIPDYARFPELRCINKYYALPFYGGAALLVFAGHLDARHRRRRRRSAAVGFFLP